MALWSPGRNLFPKTGIRKTAFRITRRNVFVPHQCTGRKQLLQCWKFREPPRYKSQLKGKRDECHFYPCICSLETQKNLPSALYYLNLRETFFSSPHIRCPNSSISQCSRGTRAHLQSAVGIQHHKRKHLNQEPWLMHGNECTTFYCYSSTHLSPNNNKSST